MRLLRIHVNGALIRANKQDGQNRPVFTIKDGVTNTKARAFTVCCPHCHTPVLRGVQDFAHRLKSGAVAWLEGKGLVEVDD